uniref:Uncharacterized protein n=1 Tax=Caenorhabditis japonica TaxID=281687 RepID=A0A8R1IML1_CAEJA
MTKPDSEEAFKFSKSFVAKVSSINQIIRKSVLDLETNEFIDSLEEAASFLPKIELYQQLTDKKQSKLLTESLDSALASLSVIKSLEDSTQKQIITSHLDIIENLLSKTVKVSDKQALIGFPSGSLDVQLLFKDFDDEWLKKVLNNGNTLRELKYNKPIRRWLVPEGQEEDFESAMARCPSHLKKKTLNEEALRRRLGSDNPQVVAHAQQQAEEEASATLKIGKRPIIPCGWGDLPHDMSGEKSDTSSDYDQGSSKSGWEDDGRIGLHHHPAAPNHLHHQHNDELVGMSWNLPGVGGNGPSAAVQPNEARNPFFAHHMQQQAQQQHHHVWPSVMEGVVMAPSPSSSATGMSSQMGMLSMSGVGGPTSTSSIAASATAISDDADGSQKKLAENLKLAVEKGHLDISLLSLPHIPSNVLDLLTEILTVIPRLDGFEDELKKLVCVGF